MSTSRHQIINNGHGLAWSFGLLLLATSCSQEEAISQDPPTEAQTRGVVFSIPLAADDAVSPDLQVFLYNATGNQLSAKVELTNIERQQDGSQILHGLIPADCEAINDDELRGHLVVLGNCLETDGSVEALQALTFEAAGTSAIPMFGAHEVQTRLDHRLEVLCPTTQLLRSGALVTVRLAEELTQAGITLQQVIVKEVNQTGYCVPMTATRLNTSDNMATGLIFNPDTRAKGDIALIAQADGSMQGLVPECEKPGNGPLEMELKFERDGAAYTGIFGQKLYFKNYADDVPFDIVRGHHYLFNIRSLQTEGELEVVVEDWNENTAEDVVFN